MNFKIKKYIGFIITVIILAVSSIAEAQSVGYVSGGDSGVTLHWQTNSVNFYIDPHSQLKYPNLTSIVQRCTNRWHVAQPNLPTLQVVAGTPSFTFYTINTSGIVVSYDSPIASFNGSIPDILGETPRPYNPGNGIITNSVIMVNGFEYKVMEIDPNNNDNSAYDLESIIMHEMGHFFGLNHDLNHRDAVMFSGLRLGEIRRELTQSDINSIKIEYQSVTLNSGGCNVRYSDHSNESVNFLLILGIFFGFKRKNLKQKMGNNTK